MNLGLHHSEFATQVRECLSRLVGTLCHFAAGNGNSCIGQQSLGLVFVNLHRFARSERFRSLHGCLEMGKP